MRLDVKKSRELQAAIFAIRSLDSTLAKFIRQQTKRIAQPEWMRALLRRASTVLEMRVLSQTAVVTVSNQNVRVQSASKGRPLSGGLNPKVDYPAVEFGVTPKRTTYERVSPKGNRHRVTRTTGTAMKSRNAKGYVFYPAAREMVPRLAALWVQTVVRTIATAFEGKQE
jgi:hypothetical protein